LYCKGVLLDEYVEQKMKMAKGSEGTIADASQKRVEVLGQGTRSKDEVEGPKRALIWFWLDFL
jgi:hypothetical protein